jgi:type IV secretory pathway VirD2 relaxase
MHGKTVGFDEKDESIDISAELDAWQKAGDERMWKFIISPEFGEQINLKVLTRDLMTRVGRDLGFTDLEWIAVAHYNTEHAHVHVALRGVDAKNQPLHLDREYIKAGIRSIAEDLCTQQIGYRTERDAATAERREVSQQRYTSLDRRISRNTAAGAEPGANFRFFAYTSEPAKASQRDDLVLRQRHTMERLLVLETMGLAECVEPDRWLVRRDFESVLRAMQRMSDRQKTLAVHGVLMSDERLPVAVLDYRNLNSIEGRVLVHGEEENGRNYLMLEGTDARVHHIYYTPEMEEARNRGGLRTNSFVRLRKRSIGGEPVMEIDELGNSDAILRNESYLKRTAQALIKRGIIPDESGWGGWLGRYQAAVRRMALEELALSRSSEQLKSRRESSRLQER